MDTPQFANQVVAPLRQTITKNECHTLILAMENFFSSKSKLEIDARFEKEQKLHEASQVIMENAWKEMTKVHPSLKEQTHLLSGGEVRHECLGQLGELTRCKNHFPIVKRNSLEFTELLSYVEAAHKCLKTILGKRKIVG